MDHNQKSTEKTIQSPLKERFPFIGLKLKPNGHFQYFPGNSIVCWITEQGQVDPRSATFFFPIFTLSKKKKQTQPTILTFEK
jgi:hypothetical protein